MTDTTATLDEARELLGFWREGLLRDAAVVAWADEVIAETPVGSLPEWVLDLSVFGPLKCMNRASADFIRVRRPTFLMELAFRAKFLDVGDAASVEAFVRWAAHACMGEDLKHPAVQFGYQLDHLWGDCDRMDLALQLVRSELRSLQSGLPSISDRLLRAAGDDGVEAG